MFSSATGIMDWLGQCAAIVASSGHAMSWITPLGLPVVQPYRRQKRHVVKTLLQTVTLSVDSDSLPVAVSKQKTAFPPNFVHSLDASHMLMTSLKMQDQGLTFASVHDSYWTHACDVPIMNEMLRDAFVELYEQPVLETLKESLTARYPDVEIPPIPERGTLDLKSVLDSRYFFH
jgi:DNA-directed RNA polymerase, mitochondrial